MSNENEEQEKFDRAMKRIESHAVLVTLAFIFILCFLVVDNKVGAKYALLGMLALRSYGLLVLRMQREWVGIILYGTALLYYSTQISPGLF